MIPTLANALSVLACLSVVPTPLADIFVDLNAANCAVGTGSVVDPVCSITAAIAIASPGDTIRIAPGTYNENVVLTFDLDLVGTAGAKTTVVDGLGAGSVVTIPVAVSTSLDGLTITNGESTRGGGLEVFGSLVLTNSTVTNNRASVVGFGGGIYCASSSSVAIRNSTISSNTAYGNTYYDDEIGYYGGQASGGGIAVFSGGNLTLEDSQVLSNRVVDAGNACWFSGGAGLASFPGATVSIERCAIAGNHSDCEAGAVFSRGGLSIFNSTISGNTSDSIGEAMVVIRPILSNVTITENGSGGASRAVHIDGHGGNPGTFQNSILAGNFTNTQLFGASVTSLGNNLLGNTLGIHSGEFIDGVNGDQVGTVANPLDPVLGPLANNGGSFLTHFPLPGSPVIDAGNPLQFELLDQRGVMRPVGLGPDIGAVEFEELGMDFCNGDGGDQMGCTDCPCGNAAAPGTIGGCINSTTVGARLRMTGDASVSLPPMSAGDLRFSLVGAPVGALCILVSGTGVASLNPMNPCFGQNSGVRFIGFDGLRCAVGNFRRHGPRTSDANGEVGVTNSPWGGEGGPPIGIASHSGFGAGETRFFQVINRDDPTLGCMRGLNTSQAVQVTFTR